LRDSERQPLWPAALFGCITHCDGYCAAVVARTRDPRTIGIDAEPIRAFGDVVLDRIALAGERAWISGADAQAPGRSCCSAPRRACSRRGFRCSKAHRTFPTCASTLIRRAGHSGQSSSANIRGEPSAVPLVGRYRFDRERVLTSAYLGVDAPAIGDRAAAARPQK
jgi:hypothetical protein